MKVIYHERTSGRCRKGSCRGAALIEVTAALLTLLILSMLLLKSYVIVAGAQRWTIGQAMTDSFVARETALGKRVPFSDITASAGSLWPTSPAVSTSTVTVGVMPGGIPWTATLRRTKQADPNNLPDDGGSGTLASNPSKMESWRLHSYLSYELAGKTYVKARTTVRTQ